MAELIAAKYRSGGTWILSTCYILSLLVILLLAAIVQQLCSFRPWRPAMQASNGRKNKCVSAFCNPALAVCQSESEWVWALGVGRGTKYADWGASAPPFLFLQAPFFWRFMDLLSHISIKEVHPFILRLAFFRTDREVVDSIFRAFVRISSPRRISTAPRSCSSALQARKSDVGRGRDRRRG